MDKKWQQVRDIFDSALRRRADERTDFVIQACGGDEILLKEVESLLSSLDSAESFLEAPAIADVTLVAPFSVRLESGTAIAHYEILRHIDEGGMGVVYLGRDTKLDRHVAIKVLNKRYGGDADNIRRFVREAKAASALNHPNILTIFEIDEIDGSHYIVSEYIEGRTLRRLIKNRELELQQIVDIISQTASALGAAHKARIVHRDIKPENIIVRDDGYVKVLDFGLAKLLPEGASGIFPDGNMQSQNTTASGMILGTVNYMSPEQAKGERVDERTDIFSLGVVLYEMIAGVRPFEGSSMPESFANLINKQAAPLTAHVSGISPELERIVGRMLAKDREERYQSIREFSSDLKKLNGGSLSDTIFERRGLPSSDNVTVAMPQTTGGGANTTADASGLKAGWYRRWPVIAAVLILLIATASGYWFWHRSNQNWAASQLLRVEELSAAGKYFEAYDLASTIDDYLPGDPRLAALMPRISDTISVVSEPVGAQVYLKRYQPDEKGAFPERQLIGTTPITGLRIPRGAQIVYLEKEGYAPVQTITSTRLVKFASNLIVSLPPIEISRRLIESSSVPDKMVFIPGGEYRLESSSRPTDDKVKLDDFFIDKYEVSNKDYKEFISAGGYARQEYWKVPFVRDGRPVSWSEAMSLFSDRTHLPGPRDWSNQNFPAGKADYPVTGITWYEAAAYAEFKGKRLPTIFEWEKAARNGGHLDASLKMPWGDLSPGDSLKQRANFDNGGTIPVDSGEFGISEYGAYNMAGNVSEWVSNPGLSGYFATGGAWGEPIYTFSYYGANPGFFESSKRGFRCARVMSLDTATNDQGGGKLEQDATVTNYPRTTETQFRQLARSYDYPKTPLDAETIETTEAADWRREKIAFNGAGGKRALAYLYLPRNAARPVQVVQMLAGSDVESGITPVSVSAEEWLGSVIKSGRAVFAVVTEGNSERPRPADFTAPPFESVEHRDMLVARYTDHRRGLDYLETRDDIDMSRLGFVGSSLGASQGLVLAAVETRYRSIFFVSSGLPSFFMIDQPDANPVNFAPHIHQPKFVLNGRFDERFPVKSAVEPMMKLFPEPKELELYDGPHAPPMEVLVPALNRFFDRTLGPVKRQ